MPIQAHCLGCPYIGNNPEWTRAVRRSYTLRLPAAHLEPGLNAHYRQRCLEMTAAGVAEPPCNDFTLDNHLLDTAIMVDAIPECYRAIDDPLVRYWTMAQGESQWRLNQYSRPVLGALPRRRWFDTPYSCSTPQLHHSQRFALDASKILREIAQARALNIQTRPIIVGPMTFLLRSQIDGSVGELLEKLLPVYEALLDRLAAEQVSWVQIDEPCLVLDLKSEQREAYQRALTQLSRCRPRPQLLLATYFGALGANLPLAINSGFEGIHIDVASAPDQRVPVINALGAHQVLSLGVIDGRNIFGCDLQLAHTLLRCAIAKLGRERVWVAPSCSLRHVPLDVKLEHSLDEEMKAQLAFAAQKLTELKLLAQTATEPRIDGEIFERNRRMVARRAWALRSLDNAKDRRNRN